MSGIVSPYHLSLDENCARAVQANTSTTSICQADPSSSSGKNKTAASDDSPVLGCCGSCPNTSMTCLFVAASPDGSTKKPVPKISGKWGLGPTLNLVMKPITQGLA